MELNVSVQWVKVHSKNVYNDDANNLAKSKCNDNIFDFSMLFLLDFFHILLWYKIPTNLPTRNIVKMCNKSKTFLK